MISQEKTTEKMKKYLYSNSIAAHPYHRIGNSFKDHQFTGLFRLQILNLYNNRNKIKEERRESF